MKITILHLYQDLLPMTTLHCPMKSSFDKCPYRAYMYFMRYTLIYLRPCYKEVQMINCIVTANSLVRTHFRTQISSEYSNDHLKIVHSFSLKFEYS